MNAIDIEKLNQLISRTDISGNDKIKWLTDFIDSREFGQQERMYSEEEVLKAQQAILGNIKDALQHKNYIIDYLKQLHEKKVL
jgi:hypothetical protein